jgi:hypothetical protein
MMVIFHGLKMFINERALAYIWNTQIVLDSDWFISSKAAEPTNVAL